MGNNRKFKIQRFSISKEKETSTDSNINNSKENVSNKEKFSTETEDPAISSNKRPFNFFKFNSKEKDSDDGGSGNKSGKFKRRLPKILAVIFFMTTLFSSCENSSVKIDYMELYDQNKKLKSELDDTKANLESAQKELDDLKHSASQEIIPIRKAFNEKNWELVISLAKDFQIKHSGEKENEEAQSLSKQAEEKKKIEDEERAKEEARRKEEEKKAEEKRKAEEKQAEERRKEEERRQYETGITYDQLARTPDSHEGKKVKFRGKVIQVLEEEGYDTVDIRLAVNGNYDTILYCTYPSNLTSSRVLENDYITVYGKSEGIYTYTSTMNASITVPLVTVEKIER